VVGGEDGRELQDRVVRAPTLEIAVSEREVKALPQPAQFVAVRPGPLLVQVARKQVTAAGRERPFETADVTCGEGALTPLPELFDVESGVAGERYQASLEDERV
jgi:hypothetical protein